MKLKEGVSSIGPIDLSLNPPNQVERIMSRYRKWRGEVIRIRDEERDKDGDPCVLIRRLDTRAHGLETWSPGLVQKVK